MIRFVNKDRFRRLFTTVGKSDKRMILLILAILLFVNIVVVCIDKKASGTNNMTDENLASSSQVIAESNTYEEITTPVELSSDLQIRLDEIAKKYGARAVQVAVICDGSVKYRYEYGYANIDKEIRLSDNSKFRLASLSKLSTAMTVMTLCEQGQMDLDSDIGIYLGYEVRNPYFPDVVITPRMLMTHTSSLVDSEGFVEARNSSDHTKMQTLIKKCWSKKKPGSYYSYSNFGIAVLAAASEKATGVCFSDYAHNALFEKIGIDCAYTAAKLNHSELLANLYMSNGNIGLSNESQMAIECYSELGETYDIYQGNLTGSAQDFAKLLCVLMNNGKYGEQQILSEDSTQSILREQFTNDEIVQCLCVQKLNAVVNGRMLYCHTGSNYGAFHSFAFDSSDRSGIVVLTSGASAEKSSNGLYDICSEVIEEIYKQ